jgi:hypothetical protein
MTINIFKNLPFRPFELQMDSSIFSIKLTSVSRKPQPWKDELIIAAKEYTKFNRHLFVSMSGGIDSEVTAISFLNAGIPFTPLILQYEFNNKILNNYDIKYAFEFCTKHNLSPMIHSVNPVEFVKMATSDDYAKYTQIAGVYMYVQIYLINLVEDMNGMLVGGGTEQNWRYSTELEFCIRSSYLTAYQYMYDNNLKHWPSFHWTTPELIRSYIDVPVVKKALEKPKNFKIKDYVNSIKIRAFHENFPELILRKKYHGYERFEEIPIFKNWLTTRFYPDYRTFRLSYPDTINQLDYDLIKTQEFE